MKTQVLTDDGLLIYDEEIKQFINKTTDEIKQKSIQISNDDTYEPLDGGE